MKFRKRIVFAIAALASALVLMYMATAQTTASVYYACVNNSSGTIHMASQPGACAQNEIPVSWNQTGPQGPAGPAGAPGAAGPMGPAGPSTMSIALLRWYEARQAGTTLAVPCATGMAFDGANIWVASPCSQNTVTKLRTSDGSLVGTYPAGVSPVQVVFDGANIWAANFESGTVTKLRASDGSLVGTYAGGGLGVAFDGANIWVANPASGTVSKL